MTCPITWSPYPLAQTLRRLAFPERSRYGFEACSCGLVRTDNSTLQNHRSAQSRVLRSRIPVQVRSAIPCSTS